MKPTRAIPIIGAAIAALTFAATGLSAEEGRAVRESAREIPVAYDVEVVVLGGGTGAVSAAAAVAGARVFLAAPYPYLGENMTATLRLWLEEGGTTDGAAGPGCL